jgi:hypothetical protein
MTTNNSNIDKKLNHLVDDILQFSNCLPDGDLYELKRKIKTSAKLVTPTVRSLNQQKRRMDKVKGMISAKAVIEEVSGYLDLTHKLRMGNSKELKNRLDNILNSIEKMEIN